MGAVFLSIFIVLLYVCSNFRRFNVLLIYLISFYLIILIGAILCIKYDVYTWHVNPFNLLLFTLIYLFSADQFKKVNIDAEILIRKKTGNLDAFFYFYIFIAIAYIAIAVPGFIANISSGDYMEVYYEVRESDDEPFVSIWEKYSYILSSKFQYPALIAGFIYLCKGKANKGVCLLLSAVAVSIVYSICIVSRTDLFQIIVALSLIYFLWRRYLPDKIRRAIATTIVPIAIVILVLFIAISASRSMFEDDFSWILEYIGRSVLTFNSIMEHPVAPHDGMNFLGTLESFSINHPSYTGKEFVPLLSRMYIDFGVAGLFIFLLVPLCLPKHPVRVADYYLIVYIFFAVLMGVLYSTVNLIQLIQTLCVFIILKYMFRI